MTSDYFHCFPKLFQAWGYCVLLKLKQGSSGTSLLGRKETVDISKALLYDGDRKQNGMDFDGGDCFV